MPRRTNSCDAESKKRHRQTRPKETRTNGTHSGMARKAKPQQGRKSGIKQERREAEPLADKLLYLTNQAC